MTTIHKYTSVLPNWLRPVLVSAMAALLLSACAYRINIQQGNFLDQKKIDQIETGMNRNQVKFLLGTPMVADAFHKDRWDYVYYVKNGRTRQVTSSKVTVYFDGDKVREVEQHNRDADTQS